MLLKGCKKNLIVVKGLGSDYIEEAYLILKHDLEARSAAGYGGGRYREGGKPIDPRIRYGTKKKAPPVFTPELFHRGDAGKRCFAFVVFPFVTGNTGNIPDRSCFL